MKILQFYGVEIWQKDKLNVLPQKLLYTDFFSTKSKALKAVNYYNRLCKIWNARRFALFAGTEMISSNLYDALQKGMVRGTVTVPRRGTVSLRYCLHRLRKVE